METVKIGKQTYTILFPELLRPLHDNERQALKNSIRRYGMISPLILDGDGGIIDGGNRARLAGEIGLMNVPTRVEHNLSTEEKRRMALELNDARRHLTPAERRRLKEERVARVAEARAEGASYREIAEGLGISPATALRDDRAIAVSDETPSRDAGAPQEAAFEGEKAAQRGGKVRGKDGKLYPPRKGKPKPKGPTPPPAKEAPRAASGAAAREPGSEGEPFKAGNDNPPRPAPVAGPLPAKEEDLGEAERRQRGLEALALFLRDYGDVEDFRSLCEAIELLIQRLGAS